MAGAIALVVLAAVGLAAYLTGTSRPVETPRSSPQRSPGPSTSTGTSPASQGAGLTSPPGSPRRGGDGFAWSFILPDDPDLERLLMLGSEIWIAGEGDSMRGVFAGPLDAEGGQISLAAAADRLRAELAMIPGGTGVSDPKQVRLPAGEALTVHLQVGALSFTGFAIVHGGKAYRLMVVGYPDAVVQAVAASLAFN